MSYFNQQQAPVTAYPPPPQANYVVAAPPAGQAAYVPTAPPPPPGYPTSYNVAMGAPPQPAQTQSRGDKAFLEGCCAAICCCCLLDMCF